ncbi:hypothetical protein HNY73_022485 [Argiope bruennichi]|uniref:Uncharacterized protein n=1 Tax=Argiope bruennichi TaxID=94029 RepID=A0A8T0E3E2_ARGBR|nr:hypothetical protein HNY73_022485 [Argiope bruennichi]
MVLFSMSAATDRTEGCTVPEGIINSEFGTEVSCLFECDAEQWPDFFEMRIISIKMSMIFVPNAGWALYLVKAATHLVFSAVNQPQNKTELEGMNLGINEDILRRACEREMR